MKNTLAVLLASALTLLAQTNVPIPITGGMNIQYASRLQPAGLKGVVDTYTLNVNIANSAAFNGTIVDTPQVMEGIINKTVTQQRALKYDLACDVVNPKNPTQTRNVGRMLGRVPISSEGVYRYDAGTLEMAILPMGNAGGFTSKFTGSAAGKPLVRPAGWMDKLNREVVSITRSVNGKTTTVALKKYDKMEFRQHVLAAGPVQIYQQVTINGEMLYDYDKYCWFLNNLTAQYADGGMVKIDRFTGTIRWVESKNRKTSGEGEYQFDIRVNEPVAAASAVFAAPSDEASFFETDTTVPALTGTMKYKDTLRGETTVASVVTVNLSGNNLTKQQVMVLGKMIIFSAIVPMNSD